MLSLLVIHTMDGNSHKYLIDLLPSHMIQYSSGYDLRFPRKRSWFESQLGNNIFFLLLFSVCVCCFYFYIFSFCIFNRFDNPPTSAFRYKISEDSRYFVLCIDGFDPRPGRCVVSLSKTFTPQKVLVIPRNRWLRLNMTEKLFTRTLNKNQNKTKLCIEIQSFLVFTLVMLA